jgi:hypothetical protein
MSEKIKSLFVSLLFVLAIIGCGKAKGQDSVDAVALIKEYNPQLVEPYQKNLETIKRLKGEKDAVSGGNSALDKNNEYKMSDVDVSQSLEILKERGLYLDLNALMRQTAQFYQKAKTNSDYQEKFAKIAGLILDIQGQLDRGDKDIAYEWNNAIEIYQSLEEGLK